MALLRYFRPVDSLPDPNAPLSSSLDLQAISSANDEVRKVLQCSTGKHGPYQKYSPKMRAKI